MSEQEPTQPPKPRKTTVKGLAMTVELNEAVLFLLCQKMGEIVQHVVGQEMAKLQNILQQTVPPPRPPEPPLPAKTPPADPIHTGLDLPLEERVKAATAKENIKQQALERQGLIDVDRTAKLLCVCRRTIFRLSSEKAIPQPVHIGTRTRWREIEILAWINEGCPNGRNWDSIRTRAIRDYEMSRRHSR